MSTESGVVRAWTSNRRARVGILGAIGAPALLLVATACSNGASHLTSSPVSRTTNAPPTSSPSSPGPIVVEAHNQRYGAILTTADGFALYQYSGDRAGGHGCTAACLASRPPLLLPAGKTRPVPGPGVTGLGTEPRGPRLQVTYRGLPLYRDITDTRPGQVTGANAVDGGGKWLLAIVAGARPAPTTPAGVATTRPQPSSPSTTQVQVQNTPATSPPARVAPVTRPPMTQAPVMRAPVTPPPVTRPPVTAPPVTRPPPTSPPTHPPTTPPPTVPPPPVY